MFSWLVEVIDCVVGVVVVVFLLWINCWKLCNFDDWF